MMAITSRLRGHLDVNYNLETFRLPITWYIPLRAGDGGVPFWLAQPLDGASQWISSFLGTPRTSTTKRILTTTIRTQSSHVCSLEGQNCVLLAILCGAYLI